VEPAESVFARWRKKNVEYFVLAALTDKIRLFLIVSGGHEGWLLETFRWDAAASSFPAVDQYERKSRAQRQERMLSFALSAQVAGSWLK